MARSYIEEHIKIHNRFFVVEVSKAKIHFSLVRAILHSRHSGTWSDKTYVSPDPDTQGVQSMLGWGCACKVGLRTVGCCSHVAAILVRAARLP